MKNHIAVMMGKRRHELLLKKLGKKKYREYQRNIIMKSLKYEIRLCDDCKINNIKRDTRWSNRKVTCKECKIERQRMYDMKK